MPDSKAVLIVDNLRKSYGNKVVLDGVSLEVERGRTKVILGPSGVGKSTLLRCINLLTVPDSGRIWLEGVELTDPDIDINRMRQRIGFVFQEFNLFNHLTVLKNVMIGPQKVKKLPEKEAFMIASRSLEKVHIGRELWNKYPAQISGGEKQRVAIARALAMEPSIILYDEPTSALDPALVGEVLQVIKELSNSGMTSLIVTHELHFALEVANELIFMYNGKIVEKGLPEEIISNPKHEIVKKYFASIYRKAK
ncbi:MAG: amino acid ABC transporter ATP-binding protein [Fervidicoccaceae archaeon]